jgi:hypothetical protein
LIQQTWSWFILEEVAEIMEFTDINPKEPPRVYFTSKKNFRHDVETQYGQRQIPSSCDLHIVKTIPSSLCKASLMRPHRSRLLPILVISAIHHTWASLITRPDLEMEKSLQTVFQNCPSGRNVMSRLGVLTPVAPVQLWTSQTAKSFLTRQVHFGR